MHAPPLKAPPLARPTQAVIFDLDGVVVDSEPLHEQAFRDVFNKLGYSDTHGVNFADYYGRSDEALWHDFVARHHPPHSFETLVNLKRRRFLDLLLSTQPIFEGLPELVERLAANHTLAIASGSPHPIINEVLAMRGLHRFFPVTVSVTDVPNPKPAPDVFLRAAELLHTPPARCCVIEDSAAGVTAAAAGGIPVIAITHTLPANALAHATHVVHSLNDVGRLLLGTA